ncbi:MAG TPA: PP2C family protein-serine/threonine phosphatase [Terracidiphilus sp.]|nr:PP2C family protein-serine/threonine phosphatase [Terracidiphilus sp.]
MRQNLVSLAAWAVNLAVLGTLPLVAQKKAVPPAPPRASGTGPAAVLDATSLGSPLVLDRDWRVGITANPAAASPNFDDSSWAIRTAGSSMAEVPDVDQPQSSDKTVHVIVETPGGPIEPGSSGKQRYAWFRLHIRLAPNHGPIALLLELPVSQNTALGVSSGLNADVFANGRLIQPEGPHGNDPGRYQAISRIYNLNVDPSVTALVLAVRSIYIPVGQGSYTTFFSGRTLMLGSRGDLARELTLWRDRSLFERLPRLIYSVLLIVLAAFLLALYFAQRGHLEYLWLALHYLVQAPIGFIELYGSFARLDSLWYAALIMQLVLASAYLFFEFLVAFLALPRKWYIRWLRYCAPILACVGPTLLLVFHGRVVAVLLAVIFFGVLLWLIWWSIFVFVTLIVATFRRNFEAGLLLVPLVLTLVGVIEPVVLATLKESTGQDYRSPLTVMAGPIPFHFSSFGDFTGILVIVLIIFFRFLRIQRTQERVSSELEAARSVQELLIPLEKPATPGFEVDSIYNPANEVGGDFFHVQAIGERGILVVIGDVAGKGLKAAMNVSMLMGALRRTSETDPARILESLNRVLVGTESFTTCQAAWFGLNGELVLANAGHLPPYLNSQEVAVAGGLPLGVLPEIHYEELRLYLHPGDRILLMSDGVVEARKPSGELFGFDRVHNLSNQSAFYLAEAAKAFGQEDDITVLTVRRLAQMAA